MALFIISIYIIQYSILKITIKDSISKDFLILFISYWTFSLLLTNLRPYGFYEVQDSTYVLLMSAVCSFVVGYCMIGYKIRYQLQVAKPNVTRTINSLAKSKLLLAIMLGISIYEIQFSLNALLLSEESTSYITEDKLDFMFMGNKLALLLWMYVMFPLFHIQCLILASLIIQKIRPSTPYLISTLLFFIVFGILNGGRTLFVIFFLYLMFTYMCFNPQKSIFRIGLKKLLLGLSIGMVLFIGMMYMTAYRVSGKFQIESESFSDAAEQMSQTPLKYSALPIVLFDISLKENYVERLGGYQYGAYTFCGVDMLYTGFISRLGVNKESSEYIIKYLQNNWINCSPTKQYNYAYTGIFSHYMDFGCFGVILFPFLFGIIVRYYIIRYLKEPSVYLFFLICFFFYLTIHSVFSNYLHSTWMILYIIILLLLDYINKHKISYGKNWNNNRLV